MKTRDFAIWGILILAVFTAISYQQNPSMVNGKKQVSDMAYSTLVGEVEAGRIKEAIITDETAIVEKKDGTKYKVLTPSKAIASELFQKKGVYYKIQKRPGEDNPFIALLSSIIPFIIMLAIMIFILQKYRAAKAAALWVLANQKLNYSMKVKAE